MGNNQLQKANQLPTSDQQLGTLTNNKILDVLVISNVARPNNFETLTTPEWKWICEEIKKDYPNLSYQELLKIITNGAKGKYNKQQFSINSFTIFKWIDMYLEMKKSMPKKALPCPKGMQSFYWYQMSNFDQQKWIEEHPEKVEKIENKNGQSVK